MKLLLFDESHLSKFPIYATAVKSLTKNKHTNQAKLILVTWYGDVWLLDYYDAFEAGAS